jgi:hypothetical protein
MSNPGSHSVLQDNPNSSATASPSPSYNPDYAQLSVVAQSGSEEELDVAAKKTKSPAKKKSKTYGGVGVFDTITEMISRDKGASIKEISEALAKKFPTREPDGMKATARIQANKRCTSKERDEKRGLVFYYRRGR